MGDYNVLGSCQRATTLSHGPQRNRMAHNSKLNISKEEAVQYLLDIPEKIVTLHVKSTDILYNCTKGDDTCGFRELRQASERVVTPFHLR